MKRLLLTIITSFIWIIFSSVNGWSQTPALQDQSLGFNYVIADITANSILRFEQKIDTGNYVSINIPPVANDASTPAGSNTYKTPLPALTVGIHSVTLRACASIGCSADSASFSFKLLVIATPTGIRIIGLDNE